MLACCDRRGHGIEASLARIQLAERVHGLRNSGGLRRRAARALIGGLRRGAGHAVLDRGPRRQQDIVLVHAHHVGALLGENPDHLERHILNPHLLAQGRGAAEQLADQRLPEHAHLAGVADIARR